MVAVCVLPAGVLFDLPCDGQPVEGSGGALACEGSAPDSMSVRSDDGALDPAGAFVFWVWACISCNCCQRALWPPPDTAELDMAASWFCLMPKQYRGRGSKSSQI